MILITKQWLKGWSACADGRDWFKTKFPEGAQFSDVYAALCHDQRYSDADWLVNHVFKELDAGECVRQTVAITGADKNKITKQVAATTGQVANAVTTGNLANAATTGNGAVAAALGNDCKAKAGICGAIVLVNRDNTGAIIRIRASKVGENGIKADTWYSLNESGEFVES